MSDDILNNFFNFREDMNEKILDSGNLSIKRFFNLDSRVYQEGKLSSKTKEMLGLVASLVKKCDECIYYHIDRCYSEGVKNEEFYEIFSIALVVGGSIIIPHIRKAVNFLDKLEEAKNKKNKIKENNDINTRIKIYTDGACTGNPGPGGFAAVIIRGSKEEVICGYEPDTTNNRMELKAVLEALKHIETGSEITVYSDSSYVINGITNWIKNWKKNNWKTSSDKLVKNKELWKKFDNMVSRYKIKFNKVKAHTGDNYNEKVDELAREQIEKNL